MLKIYILVPSDINCVGVSRVPHYNGQLPIAETDLVPQVFAIQGFYCTDISLMQHVK